jgi:hypothetical protein
VPVFLVFQPKIGAKKEVKRIHVPTLITEPSVKKDSENYSGTLYWKFGNPGGTQEL